MKQLQEILKPYFTEGQTDYDITAVLKYIKDKKNCDIYYSNGFIIDTKMEYGYYLTFSLPNQPLHLYNNTEEKDLLTLLINIKDYE